MFGTMKRSWYTSGSMRIILVFVLLLGLMALGPVPLWACQSSTLGTCNTAKSCCKHMHMTGDGIQLSSPAMPCCAARAPLPAPKYTTSNVPVVSAPAIVPSTLNETPHVRHTAQVQLPAEASSPHLNKGHGSWISVPEFITSVCDARHIPQQSDGLYICL